MKRIGLLAVAAVAASTISMFSAPAQALTCYELAFDHTPNAWVVANPPSVKVDDGNPHLRSYPC